MQTDATFDAPWGTPLKVVTIAVAVILGVVFVAGLQSLPDGPARVLTLTVPPAAMVIASLFRVCGYEIVDGSLFILRPGWRTRIPLSGLSRVETGGQSLAGSLRLWGNGGFFSFTGWFWNRRLGRYRSFANDGRRAVVLWFPDRRIVVTPGDPAAFVEVLRRQQHLHG